MLKSESLKEIATALVAFQSEVKNVKKDATNPYFKSKYATLDSIWDEVRPLLAKHGLAVVQLPTEGGLETMIMHKSGEFVSSVMSLSPAKNDPQGQGSAITYARRYALGAALGVVTETDDDANSAMPKSKGKEYVYSEESPF